MLSWKRCPLLSSLSPSPLLLLLPSPSSRSLFLAFSLTHTHTPTLTHPPTQLLSREPIRNLSFLSFTPTALRHNADLPLCCTPHISGRWKGPANKERERESERQRKSEGEGGRGGEETGSRTKLLDVFSLIHFSEHNFENCTSCISSRSIVEVRRENRLNSKYEGEFKFNCFLLGYIFNHPLVDFV